MLVVGLTGGLGSGKTTVAQMFARYEVPIIDADESAKKLTQPGQPALESIVKHFGKSILLENKLDRVQLRRLIFVDSRQRLWLEKLLHPLIREDMKLAISQLHSPYCIAVIPLLLEVEFYSFINRILVVDSPTDEQIKRVMSRDRMSREEIEAILKTQASREDRRAKAHDVIINDGEMSTLNEQVEKLHEKYLALSIQY